MGQAWGDEALLTHRDEQDSTCLRRSAGFPTSAWGQEAATAQQGHEGAEPRPGLAHTNHGLSVNTGRGRVSSVTWAEMLLSLREQSCLEFCKQCNHSSALRLLRGLNNSEAEAIRCF